MEIQRMEANSGSNLSSTTHSILGLIDGDIKDVSGCCVSSKLVPSNLPHGIGAVEGRSPNLGENCSKDGCLATVLGLQANKTTHDRHGAVGCANGIEAKHDDVLHGVLHDEEDENLVLGEGRNLVLG
ncbi:hypothetical protein ACOSQ4_003123 [Xanthoceras sorbifolium]